MKRMIKYIGLVIIAVLVTVLVMNNNAKAEGGTVSLTGYTDNLEVGGTTTCTVQFSPSAIAYTGTISVVGDAISVDKSSIDAVNGTNTITVTAVQEGTATLAIDFGTEGVMFTGDTAATQVDMITVSFTVTEAQQQTKELKLDTYSLNLEKGNSETVNVISEDVTATTWESNNTAVARVAGAGTGSATIEAVGAGTAQISVGSDFGTKTIDVTVTEPQSTDTSVTLDKTQITGLKPGETANIVVSSGEVSEWVSSDSNIAVVEGSSSNATVTAVSEGTATIKALVDGQEKASVSVTVESAQQPQPQEKPAPVINTSGITLNVGEIAMISVNNSNEVKVRWESSDSSKVGIIYDAESLCTISALAEGTATITAISKDDSTKTASKQITVVKSEEIAQDTTPPVITPGGDLTMSLSSQKVLSANKVVVWTSSDTSKVTVGKTDGIVTAVGVGKATITATATNGKTATMSITVEANTSENSTVTDPVITPNTDQSLAIGKTLKLSADRDVEWSSGNTAIATVDSNGNVKGISEGTTQIVAKADGRFSSVTVTVSSDGKATGKSNKTSTGNASTNGGNSSSVVNESVPSTGEASTGTLLLLGIITLIIATIVFRKKVK